MPQYMLIGLVEPSSPDKQAAFDEWFVDQHVEDTTKCPNFVRGRVFKLAGGHLGSNAVSQYLSVYEVDAPSYEEAERVLNEWQQDPNAWAGRAHHHATAAKHGGMPMKIVGSGWYETLRDFTGPGPAK
ncbi:MAG: hypothetical protein R3E84_02250 [Pseudomonadales bacterium]|nr:hypothetical protein [Pseudomonadales bacterium]